MCEHHICRARELRLRYGISQIELEIDRQSRGHEAMLRRAFAAVIAARRARLASLERELTEIPQLFSLTEEASEHG